MTQTMPLRAHSEAGFSMIEVMISTMLFTAISGVVISGLLSMNKINDVVSDRTEMHSGVRNATELLQQEIGQAGRISLVQPILLGAAVLADDEMFTISAPSGDTDPTADLFVGMYLTIGIDDERETVQIEQIVDGTTIGLANNKGFIFAHGADEPIEAAGGFFEGVIPPAAGGYANGSTGSVLKILGDLDGNGNMVYVEYTCDTEAGVLYRNVMDWDAGSKSAPTVDQVLLDNLEANPDGEDCFRYEPKTIPDGTCVIGVAITLTVRTNETDATTGDFLRETKALLNVAPRNVFNVWQAASLNLPGRAQPLPPTVVNLLPALQTDAEESE